jgi:ubiquitin-conjugating enzyme E2 D
MIILDKYFPASSTMATPNRQTLRIQKDLDSINSNPLPFVRNLQLSFVEENIGGASAAEGKTPPASPPAGHNQVTGVMIGPDGTPYEGGHFRFTINFPPDYPFRPPEFIFTTAMLHPNVHSGAGTACHEHLLATWRPTVSLANLLTEMHQLLREPNYGTPIQGDAISDKSPEKVRDWTREHAPPSD